MLYHIPSAPVQQQDYKSTTKALQVTWVLGVPQESLEPTTFPLENPSFENVQEVQAITAGCQVLDAPADTEQVSFRLHKEETRKADNSLLVAFTNEFQLPQDLLDTNSPDTQKPTVSIEPLLKSTDPELKKQEISFKETDSEVFPSSEAAGTDDVYSAGGQPQDSNMPMTDVQNRTQTCVCPLTASLSLASTQPSRKGQMEIIDLCASEDESSGTSGAQKPDSSRPGQSGQMMETKILPVSKNEITEKWKKGILDPAGDNQRDWPTEKLPLKKRWRKRKMADQASPIKGKIKIDVPEAKIVRPNEKNLDVKVSGSRSKVLQKEKKNTQPKKAQTTRAMNSKNQMEAKARPEHLESLPKSKLALRMMESVQVFHPLGKSNVSTVTARKAPCSTTSAANTLSTSARSVPKAMLQPVPKEQLNPCTSIKAKPPVSQPKPPPSSLAKPSAIPIWVQQPRMRPKLQSSSLKETLPSIVGKRPSIQSREGIPVQDTYRPSHGQSKGPMSTTLTFRPRTVPRDHGLLFRYSPPPPILPFEIAFRNWKRPPPDLQVSTPITEQQRPIREMMKRRAQREREEAARWTSLGRVQFFVEHQKEKDTSVMFGYP
uniref:Uncharacterized protein n=1 Tax=Sphaerodactylus townsendi TaxID=933632 RepID=A0ACB8F1G0_9SAUR